MATNAEIKTSVRNHIVDLSDETEAEIQNWVNRAIRFAQEVHNFRIMEATAEFVTDSDAGTLAAKRKLDDVPADWKARRADPWLLEGDGGSREIRWLPSVSEAVRQYSAEDEDDTGSPRHVLETEDELRVYPLPDGSSLHDDGEYRLQIPYWKYLPALAGENDTNWFTDNAEYYVIWKAAAEGMMFNRDTEEAAVFAVKAGEYDANSGKLTGELARLVRLDKRSRLSRRMTLTPRRDVYAARNQSRSF